MRSKALNAFATFELLALALHVVWAGLVRVDEQCWNASAMRAYFMCANFVYCGVLPVIGCIGSDSWKVLPRLYLGLSSVVALFGCVTIVLGCVEFTSLMTGHECVDSTMRIALGISVFGLTVPIALAMYMSMLAFKEMRRPVPVPVPAPPVFVGVAFTLELGPRPIPADWVDLINLIQDEIPI